MGYFLIALWVGAFSVEIVRWSVICDFPVVLRVGLCSVFIAFSGHTAGWSVLVFIAFSGRTVGWSVLCVHSTFWSYCGLVCVLCS